MKRNHISTAVGLALGLFSIGASAADVRFRLPLDVDTARHYYYDHDTSSGLKAWNCTTSTYNGHRGTDYSGGPRGTAIYAGAVGTITRRVDGFGDGSLGSTAGGGFGNHVALQHGDGTVSWYGHMTINSVTTKAVGATVACSEKLGGVGTSGSSSGLHLHFEPRRNNVGFDPYAGGCGTSTSWWVNQGSGAPSTACQAAPPPPGPRRGTIVGQNNLCLDVAGAATADGTRIIVFNCNGHTAQQWYTSTAREIKNPLAHKCMVLQNGQATEGAQIWEWGCGGQADQKWHLRNMAVVGAASNKCLDVPDGNWVNGAKLRMWSCNGSPAQRFTFDSATRTLRGPNNMCVDLPGGNTTSGTQLQLWTCNGATAQQWNPGNGGFRSAVNTSRCMDVKGNGTADGTPVHLWECRANEPAQQFGLRGQIENNLGKCLDIPGGNAVPGQATQLFTCNGQIPQRWTMWMPN